MSGDTDLAQVLRWAGSFSEQTKATVDDAKYLHSLRKFSFDMQDFGFHNPTGFDNEAIEKQPPSYGKVSINSKCPSHS